MKRIVLVLLLCLSLVSACGLSPEAIATQTATAATAIAESWTKTPMPATSTATIISTPTLGIGSTLTSDKDGMTLVFVPAGEFTMGSDADDGLAECQKFRNDCQRWRFENTEPPHTVNLNAFWIDQTEVTNAMYAKCVADGACQEPTHKNSHTHSSYYDNPEFDRYPVISVDWNMAKVYCEWADRRLPTEAEWEKAARGENAFVYPWGDESPNANLLNYNRNVGDTTEVGIYPDGKSIYGALDMAGNVWEWVNDWYQNNYYATLGDNTSNPQGPSSGDWRVLRGGSRGGSDLSVRSANRNWDDPADTYEDVGFRCAVSENEQAQSTPSVRSATSTSQPITTDIPAPTETSIPPTPEFGVVGSTLTSDKDGMTLVFVPAGEFTMGSDNGLSDEKPVHTVNLDAFWIDQTEVTNTLFAMCVQDGGCTQPSNLTYYSDSNYADHPVVYVSWNDANAYCSWAERRLPTEAEWEKAARGTDARTYPWGEDISCSLANYWGKDDGCVGDTTEIGSYMDGASIYGALDMAGNVWEWVSSLYQPYPYNAEDGRESLSSSDARVLRSGAWAGSGNYVRSAIRYWYDPTDTDDYIGFRCSRSP